MEYENEKNYDAKLNAIFNGFLNPKCKINNDVYLEKLLTHLSGKYDKGILIEYI